MENLNLQPNKENQENSEEYTSKIHLVFSRHEEKESAEDGQSDDDVRLTEQGRMNAVDSAELDDVSQAVAYGSPKKRAQETAGLKMSGKQPEITGEESLEELKKKLDAGREVGSKLGTDKRLDFYIDFNSPYGKWLYEKFKEGNYIEALLLESDAKAEEFGDPEAETGMTYTSRLSEVISRYVKAANRWNELVSDEEDYDDTLTRIFGTHAGVNEAFLGKIIEKVKGEDELRKFIAKIPEGFDYNEGFDLNIVTNDKGEKKVMITYEHVNQDGEVDFRFDEELDPKTLESFIE